jgi:hypothetical protein
LGVNLASQVADHWLRRKILAAYSPDFYRWVGIQHFKNRETGRDNLFHSLPPDQQKELHDKWQQSQQRPSVQVPQREFREMMERATGGDVEAEAAQTDRKEMAEKLKELKTKNLPDRIFKKEKLRLVQEMRSRALQRKKDREAA